MSMVVTRSPLEPIGMNGASSRRSARLSAEGVEENAPPTAKKSKLGSGGRSTTAVSTKDFDGEAAAASATAASTAASGRKKRKVYDEDVDGFTFNKSKRAKGKAPAGRSSTPERTSPGPVTAPAPSRATEPTATKSVQTKIRRRLPTTPERDAAEKPVRRSKRLSSDNDPPPPATQPTSRPSPHKPSHAKSHLNHDVPPRSPARSPEKFARPLTIEKKRRRIGGTEEGTAAAEEEEKILRIHLPFADTPVIKRNKEMRKASAENAHRRSSSGMRGRRASSLIDEGRGNALPHPEVPTTEFFKHISADLTEPRRMRCLLGWCGQRSLPSKPSAPNSSSPTATLEFQAQQSARVIQEELSQDLITKGSLSDWFSRDENAPLAESLPRRKMPNPRNVANAAKAVELERELERLKAEQAEWTQLLASAAPDPPSHTTPPTTSPLSPLNPDLLESPQRALLARFHPSTTTSLDPASLQSRLHSLSSHLEFRVDQFADGVHALAVARTTADKLAERSLAEAAEVLEKRERERRENGKVQGVEAMDALKGLARVLNGPSRARGR